MTDAQRLYIEKLEEYIKWITKWYVPEPLHRNIKKYNKEIASLKQQVEQKSLIQRVNDASEKFIKEKTVSDEEIDIYENKPKYDVIKEQLSFISGLLQGMNSFLHKKLDNK